MEIGIFGVEDILLIPWVKMQKKIEEYVKNQLQEDKTYDQLSLLEYVDPFTGEQVKGSK